MFYTVNQQKRGYYYADTGIGAAVGALNGILTTRKHLVQYLAPLYECKFGF